MAIAIKKIIKGLRKKHRTSIGNSAYSRRKDKRRTRARKKTGR